MKQLMAGGGMALIGTVLVLSGVSTMDTLKTYAYRPSVVLNGVGEIVSMAKAMK